MENFINKYVVVRGDRSGVFAGTLVKKEGQDVTLKDSRRLWYWDGANSISQIANEGVKRSEGCRFSVTVEDVMICDAIEVLVCTEAAEEIIKKVPEWKQ